MNNKNVILAGAAAIVAIIAVSGFAFSSFAADTAVDTDGNKFFKGRFAQNLTEEQKANFEAKRDEMEAQREERMAEMNAALNGGYDAWVKYVKEEVGEDAPILDKINADNFARFKEAHGLMEQGRTIMEELGVEAPGMGMHMKGMGRGMMMGGGRMNCMHDLNNDTDETQVQ